MFKLVIQDDEGKTTVVPLIRDEITIGRKEGNTIRLTERNVSRRHARILRNNGEVQIEDLGSYNGIRVNNARIAERVSLRVSDQVQIGDYKLYLKAEGVEQIDDARTMPVERVESVNTATDVMPAVGPAPTQPMPIATPVPGTLVGNPNRTLVAIADTDPEGRPVATPAQVAALTAPVGYGKLVVLSSNFAGKEFELSRPQMIIGRTDENDIVINHRSISRNHAKLVREPETGRYTISDLQSSNGVRVNGQDYGKVELRRGDVVDLGHVRLRFVEPGEDFVFARDAVITDVPDSGGSSKLLVAIVVGVIVIGAIVTFVLTRSKDEGNTKPTIAGSSEPKGPGSGSAEVADAAVAIADPVVPDAAEAVQPPTPPDASATTVQTPNTNNEEAAQLKIECLRHQVAEKWGDLDLCADKMKSFDAKLAKEYKTRATEEVRSAPRIAAFEQAIRDKNLKRAKAELDLVWSGSTQFQKLKTKYDGVESGAIDEVVARLDRVNSGDCKEYQQILAQERASKPPRVAAEAARRVKCSPPAAPACDAEALAEKGKELFAAGSLPGALQAYEQSIACRPDPLAIQKALVVACNMRSSGKAKPLWKKLSPALKTQVLGVCVRNGIQEDELNGS